MRAILRFPFSIFHCRWGALCVVALLAGCTPPGPHALLEGQRLVAQGKYFPAIEQLRTAVLLLSTNASPRDTAQAWNYLGLACHYAGRTDEAERAYLHAQALDHDLSEAHYNLGCLWLEENKLDVARAEFTTYTLSRPYSAAGFCELGATQLKASESGTTQARLRELAVAENSFKDALKLGAQNPDALNGLGLVHFYRSQPAEAVQYFNQALKARPEHGPALLNLAIVSQRYLRDRPAALQSYREYLALKPAPTNSEAVLALVRQLEQEPGAAARPATTNPGASIGPLAANTRSLPSDTSRNTPPLRTERGTTSAASPAGNVEEARVTEQPAARVAQDVSPSSSLGQGSSPGSLTSTSSPSAGAAGTKNAKRPFLQRINPLNIFSGSDKPPARQATPPSPGTPAPNTEVASDAAQSTPYSGARYDYRSSGAPAAGDRDAAERASAQGLQAYKAHRLSEAVQSYRSATRLDPSCFDAYYNLGLVAAEAGNLQTALRAYESALAIQPDSADTRYNFALALRQANYFADAVNELEKLVAKNPNEARAHLALGNLYAQQFHQPAQARQHYLRVLELDPHNKQANAIRFWLADTRP